VPLAGVLVETGLERRIELNNLVAELVLTG